MSSMKKPSKLGAKAPCFGEWLREMREERKLPLRTVAAAAEMDQAHLSKVELGQRLPTPEQTSALAKFFGQDLTFMEARRIAEKFRMENAGNPAMTQALQILHDAPIKMSKFKN
jgi:transcriptional regulator with XRE-family HTH domain